MQNSGKNFEQGEFSGAGWYTGLLVVEKCGVEVWTVADPGFLLRGFEIKRVVPKIRTWNLKVSFEPLNH